MLGAIGLDGPHEAAYRALVAAGAAEVRDLARRLTLGEYETERTLRRLEQQGLAARSTAGPGRWVATEPGVALGALLSRQRRELEQAEAAAALLEKEYGARALQPAVEDLVEVVTGAEAVSRRALHLRLAAHHEVCTLLPGPLTTGAAGTRPASTGAGTGPRTAAATAGRSGPGPGFGPGPGIGVGVGVGVNALTGVGAGNAADPGAGIGSEIPGPRHRHRDRDRDDEGAPDGTGAGPRPVVVHRLVLDRAVLSEPAGPAALAALVAQAAEDGHEARIRVVDAVPTELTIADRSLAMVPLTGRHRTAGQNGGAAGVAGGVADDRPDPTALVVHACGLLDSLAALFASVWREALPLWLGAGRGPVLGPPEDGPDPTDLEILSLLLAGLTDASVAKQLDLGLRTVQRRVRRLMELTGGTTRLQLGWHAFERGWVARGIRPKPAPRG